MSADKAASVKPSQLVITPDHIDNWLYVKWSGRQSPSDIKNGGRQMVQAMRSASAQFGTRKVLNDNLEVVGSWSHSIEWAAREWFPTMFASGLKHFAWVLSPDALAGLSGINVAMDSGALATDAIHTFTSLEAARAWLRSLRDTAPSRVNP